MKTCPESATPPQGVSSEPVDDAPRMLARQLARPLTDEEIDLVAGGMASRADTNCETGCTCDCGS